MQERIISCNIFSALGKPITTIHAHAQVIDGHPAIYFTSNGYMEIDSPTGTQEQLDLMTDAEIVAYCDAWLRWDSNEPLPAACRVHGINPDHDDRFVHIEDRNEPIIRD